MRTLSFIKSGVLFLLLALLQGIPANAQKRELKAYLFPYLPNQDVFYPRLAVGSSDNTNNTRPSTWWVKDVSFLRLKQLNIAYSLPQRWIDHCFLKSASVYLMGTNLLTFSNFKLWDPELNTINGTAYPNVSSYSIGVKFSF